LVVRLQFTQTHTLAVTQWLTAAAGAAKQKTEGRQKPHRKEIIVLEARAAYTEENLRDILWDRNDQMPTEPQGKQDNKSPWPEEAPSSIAASVREHKYEETVASAMRAAKLASAAAATATRRASKNMQEYTDENLRDILAEDRNDKMPTVSEWQLTNKDQLTNKVLWALAHNTSEVLKTSENTESTDQGLLCMPQKSLRVTNMLDAMTSFTSTLSFESCSSPQSSLSTVIPSTTDTRVLERNYKSIMKKRK